MALQFDPSPYLKAFQIGRENEEANRQRKFDAYNQALGTVDKMAQIPQQNRDERMKQLVQMMQIEKSNPGMNMQNFNNYVNKGELPMVPDMSQQQPMADPQANFPTQQPVPGMATEGSPASLIDRSPWKQPMKKGTLSDIYKTTPKDYSNIQIGSDEFYQLSPDEQNRIITTKKTQDEFTSSETERGLKKAQTKKALTEGQSTFIPQYDDQGKVIGGYTVPAGMKVSGGGKPPASRAGLRNPSVEATYNLYKTARDGLLTGLEGSITGPIMGRIPSFTSEQQIAEGGVAAMAPVLKQLFRVAGEGVFTDRDQALLLQMIPTRATNPEARKKQIQNIDNIVRAKLGIQEDIGGANQDQELPQIGCNFQGGKVLNIRRIR